MWSEYMQRLRHRYILFLQIDLADLASFCSLECVCLGKQSCSSFYPVFCVYTDLHFSFFQIFRSVEYCLNMLFGKPSNVWLLFSCDDMKPLPNKPVLWILTYPGLPSWFLSLDWCWYAGVWSEHQGLRAGRGCRRQTKPTCKVMRRQPLTHHTWLAMYRVICSWPKNRNLSVTFRKWYTKFGRNEIGCYM